MAENWREKFKEQIISSPDYVGNKTVSDPDWREKMKAAVIDGSAAKAYNAESKRMATEAAYNKKVSQGKSAYEKYLSGTKSDGKKKKSFLDYFANVGYAGDTSLPNGGMSSAVMQIERDHDKPQPINISALSDDQLKDFYYLYAESPEKAKEYVEETNNKNAAIKADERAKWAGKNTGTRILSAVAQAPVSAISMADYLNQLAWYNATGEVYTERNADSPTMLSRSLIGGAAQGLTEKGLFNTGLLKGEIDESIPIVGGMSLGSAYQLGTSMINSAVSAATQGSIGAIFMGGSAASNAFYDALDKGASADQAIYNGLAQGTAEALFEYVSLDNLIKMDVSAPLIKNVLKQGGIEASEEAMTSISNYVTDAIIMKGRSEYAELLEKYNGNKSKAYMAMVNQVAQDAIGGFISGGGLTLINYGTNGVFNSRQTKKAYSPVVQDLVAESLELNPDNKLAKKIQDKINSGKSISGRNITKLINQNEADMQANDRATIQAAAAEQLTKYGESGDVEALASAITKLTAGENLSRSERALIDNSEYGQRVANELAPENIDSGEYNTGWAETLGTDRINAEAYSRLLQDAQVETEQQPVDTAPVVENIQQSPTVRETAEVTSSETPTSQTVKSSLPASDTQADTKSSVKDLSTKYGKQAGAFIHTYQQGQDIKKYDEAYSNAYDYGRSGVPFSTVKGLEGVAYLTEKQRELAYDAGVAASNTEADAKANDRTSRANGKAGRRTGAVKLEGAPASSLNDQQKRATRVLRTVAEATGVDIILYKSDVNEAGAYEGANGRFDPKSPDKIYIDLNSGLLEGKDANDIGKYAMLRTFSHEFVHFVEFWNSVRYNELRKLVFEEINAHGENVNDLIDTKIEETGLSYERASREVVAEAMTDILPDSKFVQNMAESHKSLFNKLLEKLKEFAADIRAYFKTIGSNRDAGAKALKEQVGETVKYLDSIIDMFDTAATEAVETFQKAYAVDETEHVADKLENVEASTASEETETAEAEAAQVKPEPKTTTSEHGYTVTDNNEYGSVEVKFDDKPAEAVRDVLKANKFRWNKANRDHILQSYGKADEGDIRFQQRTSPLTDREVLSIAASEVNVEGLTDGERDALNIFKRRLDNLNELEQKRAEEGRKYKEQQFGANVDRAEAKKTLNRMKILDDQIKRASSEVLDVEKKEVLKRVLQRSRKVVEKAEREHGQELLRRYRDRRNNAAAIKKYRDRITVTSMQLSDWLLKNSDKEHVPEVLKKPVLELLTSIDFSSKRLLSGGQETKADKKFGANLAALNKLLEGQQGAIDGVDNAVDNIGAYLDISAENRQFLNDLVSTVASASSDGTTFTINRMTSEELKNFSHFLKNLSTAIRKANATLANARYENIPSMAQDSMAHMEAMGEARALDGTKLVKLIGWKNATPYYAFKRFGEAGKSLFEGLYKGWGKMAFHQQEILNFTKELYKAKEVRKWRSDIHDITLEDGSKIQMSTAQIMELSMLMKREQALKHINGVGIRIGNIKTKSGIKQDTNYYKLTVGDMDNIKKLLTQRQLKVAQDMQKYMAKRGAEWGNEISMARFGYEFYTEGENYYPIKTDDNSRPMRDTDIQGNSMFRLLNLSASKSLNQYANNALVVGDIFDTFTAHMTDMAKLNALGLPLLDAIKWFNYRERTNNPDGTINEQSLTKSMEKAFGKAAGNYFRTLMKDINGVKESGDRSGDIFNKMLTRYKIAAVAANIRVALLQPTSYVRAQYIIKKRHLLNAFVFKKNGYNEAMKYSGTAVWKSLGYYDTDIARSMRTQIENGDAVLDKVRDWSMGLAELGDKRTWGRLWVACKLQTKSENPRLTGDALCKATAELFDEMIYATQVMDSTLTRSEIMRGTTRADKLVSAFGAEPTLSANIVMDAASEYMIDMRKTDARTAWRKNKDKIALAFTTYVSSAAFAAFVESLWDAVRDDDDYETFLEKFMQAFLGEDGLLSGNLVQDLTIIGKIPELKAIIEVLTGDKSSDMSIASLESISSTYSIWKETIQLTTGELQDPTKVTYYGKMTPWGKIYKTLQALSQISGVAVSNGARDVIAVWNTIAGSIAPSMKLKKLKTYDPGTAGSIKHAYLGGTLSETEAIDELIKTGGAKDSDEAYWLVKQWETGSGKYEALKGAIMANDAAAFNSAMSELTANGVEEKTARSEAASIIGDLFNGTDDEPASINAAQAISMLQRYGGKDSDEANDTVNLWKFKAGDEKYKDISMPAVRKYNEYCAGVGISKDMYFDAWSTINDIHGEDYDGDGKNDAYSAMDKKLSYIDSLSISSSQKTALALANGISETQINNRAPW